MPLIDGAHFRVVMTQSGMIVRAVNEVAKSAPLGE